MPRIAYRLLAHPGSGFHLGREGLEQETSSDSFASDSLFSAIVSVIAELYGADAVQQFVTDVREQGALRLSSAFPMIGDIPLFPLPRLRINLTETDKTLNIGKTLKKIRYVSASVLLRLLERSEMNDWLPSKGSANKGLLLNGGSVWIAKTDEPKLPQLESLYGEPQYWNVGTVPRVTLDRVSSASTVYQVGRTVFAEGCGLWFMADIVPQYADLLEEIVAHLGDVGIGGERSAGYGKFDASTFDAPKLPTVENAPLGMLLSRYHPQTPELEGGVLGEGAAYDLVDIGGWLGSVGYAAQRRQRVRMLEAGSVISLHGGVPLGQIPDVRPQYPSAKFPHPIYRSGIGLLIGCREEVPHE